MNEKNAFHVLMMRDNIEKKSDEKNDDIDGTSVDQIGSPESNPQKR